MPFDASIAARIRDALARTRGVEEKRMFGGVVFMSNGDVLVGVWEESLVARVGPDAYDDALLEPHVREFDVTGRPMAGWVTVRPDGIEEDVQLGDWVRRAEEFVRTLPGK